MRDKNYTPNYSRQRSDAPETREKIPLADTNAEVFYYKKQINARTLMVVVLQGGEELEGTIEWFDREALKINRTDEPNVLVLKHNIKYMFKAEDRPEKTKTKKTKE